MMAFDSNLAPVVGQQVTLTARNGAAVNSRIDLLIERGSEMGAPKYMEWYGAFGLMVTLIWLYLEYASIKLRVLKPEALSIR